MSLTTIEIDGRLVGEGQPCYVIAEAGVNHNGDPGAGEAADRHRGRRGADAVKFQKRTPADILTRAALERPYTVPTSLGRPTASTATAWSSRRTVLDADGHAKTRGITLLASGWDVRSVDFLEALGMPAYKIASADCSNLPLIEYIAKGASPVLLLGWHERAVRGRRGRRDDPPPQRSARALPVHLDLSRPTTTS